MPIPICWYFSEVLGGVFGLRDQGFYWSNSSTEEANNLTKQLIPGHRQKENRFEENLRETNRLREFDYKISIKYIKNAPDIGAFS